MNLDALFDVRGRVALVTGGSRGIGAMIAEGLLRAGAKVYICARKAEPLAAAAERLASFGDCVPVVANLGTAGGCEAVHAAIAAHEARLDILVNNAGAAWTVPLEDFTREAFERVLAVNLTGPFELIRALLPLLQQSASDESPARIINIASVGGFAPPGGDGYAYSASKGGLIMLTRHLATRLASRRITVNAIAPGVFPSRMTQPYFNADGTHAWKIPLHRVGAIEDISGAVIFLASRAGSYVTGALLPVSGGLGTAEPTGGSAAEEA
jgi:NAD(P)-dependent dehydrogenase (short-subunit alcohol dehydrogenase family)